MRRTMKVAVVTPYYKESRGVLERCIRSVAAQSYPCTHYLVADGFPQDLLTDWPNIRHVSLPDSHRDCGNTPRAIGAICALNSGFEAMAFLDADNWYAEDHIASLVDACRRSGAHVALSDRRIVFHDGQLLDKTDPEDAQRSHADTSTFFITDKAAFLLPYWAMMDQSQAALCDRIMFALLTKFSVPHVWTGKATMYYETNYTAHFVMAGRPVPARVHDIDIADILKRQSVDRSIARTRMDLTARLAPVKKT